MEPTVVLDLEAIRQACELFGVRRLRVFGSFLTERFDPKHSDVDFLVDFLPDRADGFADYFGLQEALAHILNRQVDLVVAGAVRNPFFKAAVFESAEELYAA